MDLKQLFEDEATISPKNNLYDNNIEYKWNIWSSKFCLVVKSSLGHTMNNKTLNGNIGTKRKENLYKNLVDGGQ